jgi:hypothetical protein
MACKKKMLIYYDRSWNVHENKQNYDKKPENVSGFCAQLKPNSQRFPDFVMTICRNLQLRRSSLRKFPGPNRPPSGKPGQPSAFRTPAAVTASEGGRARGLIPLTQ